VCVCVWRNWRTSFKIKMNARLSRRAELKRIQDFCTNRHLQAPSHTHKHTLLWSQIQWDTGWQL